MPTAGDPFGLCASVPPQRAQRALERLGEEDVRDPRYRVRQDGDRVLIPVRDRDAALEVLEEARPVRARLDPNPKWPPIERVRERLGEELTEAQKAALPTGWTRLGDVLVLRLPDELATVAGTVAQAYAEVLDADTVLDLEGSTGPRREPRTRLLYGDPDTETVHTEHGIDYHLDPAEVMFSPGNHSERHRLRSRIDGDETLVDLFAGIGYFTVPLADAGARVTACEVNPTAADYLGTNLEANGVAANVDVRVGDCRQVAPAGVADRVLMGYLPGTADYLDVARRALADEGGVVHYHDAAPRPDPQQTALERVLDHEALEGCNVEPIEARTVKTLDPRSDHVALDLEIRP